MTSRRQILSAATLAAFTLTACGKAATAATGGSTDGQAGQPPGGGGSTTQTAPTAT